MWETPTVKYTVPLLMIIFVFIACGEVTPEQTFRVGSVLPATAVPGEEVTLYGAFPAEVSLTFAGDPLPLNVAPTTLRFTVPDTVIAGTHALELESDGEVRSALLSVAPRLDSVTVEGEKLSVVGAGWTTEMPVTLFANDTPLPVTHEADALSATLPANLPYGSLSVRIRVAERSSAVVNVVREAGAATGRVLFPASSNDQTSLPDHRMMSHSSVTTRALIIHASTNLQLVSQPDLVEVSSSTALNATRLKYKTKDAARIALTEFLDRGVKAEWDLPISTFSSQPLTVTTPTGEQWFYPLIRLEEAWTITNGEGVTVAVLDTGVDPDHPDLKSNLLGGYDFIERDDEPSDLVGHGTHVAGLVGANGNVKGAAPNVSIVPVRVLEGLSGGSTFTVAEGILWAAGLGDIPNPNPADIITLSLGSSGYSEVIASAVSRAQAAGVILVAATGNAGGPLAYPAALPGVISVTALAGPSLAYQPWYANKGAGTWLTAYGGDTTQDQDEDGIPDGILSTDLRGYSLRMGTSMAAPQVAGLAALSLAAGVPKHLIRDTLAGTSRDLGVTGQDLKFGYGLATGNAVTGVEEKVFIVALKGENLLSWTLLQADGSYTLNNLPPGQPLTIQALSDHDANGVLGEHAELDSAALSLTPTAAETHVLADLTLKPADGTMSVTLEATP